MSYVLAKMKLLNSEKPSIYKKWPITFSSEYLIQFVHMFFAKAKVWGSDNVVQTTFSNLRKERSASPLVMGHTARGVGDHILLYHREIFLYIRDRDRYLLSCPCTLDTEQ